MSEAKTIGVVERERERESYVLENKTGLVFVLKIQICYVKYRTYRIFWMRSFCVLFSDFTSGCIWNIRIKLFFNRDSNNMFFLARPNS